MTGLRIAGVGAHHSTTADATTANTPYAMPGSRRQGALTRQTAVTGRVATHVDAGVHFPSDVLLGALIGTSAAQATSWRSRLQR